MRQFQFEYKNVNNFRRELMRVKRFCNNTLNPGVFFQLFTGLTDFDEITLMTDELEREFPEAYYYGFQTFGNILDGDISKDKTMIVCSVFEHASTKSHVMYLDVPGKPSDGHSVQDIWDFCNANPWVKGVEIVSSAKGCNALGIDQGELNIRDDIKVFGGVAANPDEVFNDTSYVFFKGRGFSDTAAIAVIICGEDLHLSAFHVVGWEGLGKTFRITDCEGPIIRSLDNIPPMEIYKTNLGIEENENFFTNAMQFPILVEEHGIDCLRVPLPSGEHGEVLLMSEPELGARVRLSYGNRNRILQNIYSHMDDVVDFAPECIRTFSCAVRRTFWGKDIGLETKAFNGVSPTVGFYTHGELLRIGNYLHHMNSTLVICLTREGEAVPMPYDVNEISDVYDYRVTLADRILKYLNVMTAEAENQYNNIIGAIAQSYKTLLLIDYKENRIT